MQIAGKDVVVTGGAMGIGKGLAERFHKEGAKAIAVADIHDDVQAVARSLGGMAVKCDVSREGDIQSLVEAVESKLGPIDLFCSNAGIGNFKGDKSNAASSPNSDWERGWAVNVMSHVYAARALLPRMVARKSGYFLHTVSAAGLLNQIGSAVYGTTKHAAVGFAENLAITHRDDGIRVSILCPQGVDTPLLRGVGPGSQDVDGILSVEQVAQAVVEGIGKESFLILPHGQVLGYMRKKTDDYDRWIGGMAKLQRQLKAGQVKG